MKHVLGAWPVALRMVFKDPVNLMLFLIPGVVAMVLYLIVGAYALKNGTELTEGLILKYVVSKEVGSALYYLVTGLMTLLFFLLVSWTFVLLVGVLASPFNDLMSARIERKLGGMAPPRSEGGFSAAFTGMGRTILNELKKITGILAVTVVAVGLNFFPLLYPIALVLLALLMSAQFLDYSWSRHSWGAGRCFKDLVGNFWGNFVAGAMFLGLIAIPLFNALVPGLATAYYTVLWTKRQTLPPVA